jgi:hypothetical protein
VFTRLYVYSEMVNIIGWMLFMETNVWTSVGLLSDVKLRVFVMEKMKLSVFGDVCLFVCVGPRKRVYCSLQAYCTYPMCFQCSHFHRQDAPRHNDAGDPSSKRCNLCGEKCPLIWPKVASSTLL